MTTSQPDCTVTKLCDQVLVMITDLMSNHHTWEQIAVKGEILNIVMEHILLHIRVDPRVTLQEKLFYLNTVSPRVQECTLLLKDAMAALKAIQYN